MGLYPPGDRGRFAYYIGEIDPKTDAIKTFPLPGGGADGMTASPDGDIWFTGFGVGKFNPSDGTTTLYRTANSTVPHGIIASKDGSLWVNERSDLGPGTGTIDELVSAGSITQTALTIAANPATAGQSVTLTATVAASAQNSPSPTGTVIFYDGAVQASNELGSSALSGVDGQNQAVFQTPSLAKGAHQIVAVYQGDNRFEPSESAATAEAIVAAATAVTTTQLVSSASPVVAGQNVILTATIQTDAQAGTPTGSVAFYDGAVLPSNEIGTGALAVVGGQDQAMLQTSSLTVGAQNITAVYQGDSAFQGSQSAGLAISISVVALSHNQLYVEAVYNDVLGRAPDADGLTYWTRKLDAGTPRSSVADSIGKSDEYYQNLVIKPDYVKVLGRAADSEGLAHWTTKMDSGTTDQQLAADLAASDEVYAKAGGTNLAWVDSVYKLLLNRTAEVGGETYWVGRLAAGMSRSAVAQGIANSQENNTQLINDDYYHYLGRAADANGLAFWLTKFAQGQTNEDVIAGFTAADEYYNKHTG